MKQHEKPYKTTFPTYSSNSITFKPTYNFKLQTFKLLPIPTFRHDTRSSTMEDDCFCKKVKASMQKSSSPPLP